MFRNITNVDFSGRFHPQSNSHNCKKYLTSNPVCHELQFLQQSQSFYLHQIVYCYIFTFVFVNCLFSTVVSVSVSNFFRYLHRTFASLPLFLNPSSWIVVPLPNSSKSSFYQYLKLLFPLHYREFAQTGQSSHQSFLFWLAAQIHLVKDHHNILIQPPNGQQQQVSYLVFWF